MRKLIMRNMTLVSTLGAIALIVVGCADPLKGKKVGDTATSEASANPTAETTPAQLSSPEQTVIAVDFSSIDQDSDSLAVIEKMQQVKQFLCDPALSSQETGVIRLISESDSISLEGKTSEMNFSQNKDRFTIITSKEKTNSERFTLNSENKESQLTLVRKKEKGERYDLMLVYEEKGQDAAHIYWCMQESDYIHQLVKLPAE